MSIVQTTEELTPLLTAAADAGLSERPSAEQLLTAEVAALVGLNDLSFRLWRSSSLEDGLGETLVAVMELLSTDKGNIQLLDSESQTLRIVAHKGFQANFLDFFSAISAEDDTACRRALRQGQRVIIEDVELDQAYGNLRPAVRAAGYRAVVSTPLIGATGRRLGVVSTHFSRAVRPTDQELRHLDLYLRQVTAFIERCQMEKALLDANHRKDEFLALLAHELRNPLAPIRYALAGAKSAACTATQRAHAEDVIERQVANMSRLLDDLLDISRMSIGKLELRKQATELTAVLDAALEAAGPSLEAKGHTLAIDLPLQPVWLTADPMRLAQVFSNLLINAAKYTNSGGRIEIVATAESEDVTVRVRDNGIGIERETLPRLFAPFFQCDAVGARAEGGLGMGLALARGLVTLHGGSIAAFSEGTDRGSEFLVRLPSRLAQARPGSAAPVPRENSRARALRVLLADDNRDAADTCASLLELAGHEVRTAYSGRGALELAASFHPHVALLDIGLPDLDGYQLAQRFREAGWGKDAVLIAVTGWGREEDRKRAFAAGFDQHLVKPIAGEALQGLLRALPNGG